MSAGNASVKFKLFRGTDPRVLRKCPQPGAGKAADMK